MTQRIVTEVDGLTLALTNLDAPLFPDGFTKAELINYVLEVAEVALEHLKDRVITRVRFPAGTGGEPFYEKNAPGGTPSWVNTARVRTSEGEVRYVTLSRRADLVWLANLKAVEWHAPQWTLNHATQAPEGVPLEGPDEPRATSLMLDLDPGPGVSEAGSAEAAILAATALAELGLECWPKSSGNKGLQLSAPIAATPSSKVFEFARAFATDLSRRHPRVFTASVAKSARAGLVFVDYAQNLAARNTICAYSMRGLAAPSVSTPLTWDEVGAIWRGAPLRTEPSAMLERIQAHGDLWAAQLPSGSDPVLPEPPA